MKNFKKKINQIICVLFKHKWSSEFLEKRELEKPISKRTYCTRCGKYFSEEKYRN